MSVNRIAKTRRGPTKKKAEDKGIRYADSDSDEICHANSGSEDPHESSNPGATQENTVPEAAQNDTTPEATPDQRPPEDLQDPLPPLEPGWYDHPTNFTPDFWDNLSRAWLTKRGLRELNRRNKALPYPVLERPDRRPRSVARWAMRGGPDTRHLRGYKTPEERNLLRPRSTGPLKRHPRAEPLSAYDNNLAQYLHDNGIHLVLKAPKEIEMPSNILTINERLNRPFPALGPKVFTGVHFVRWKDQANKVEGADMMKKLFRTVIGGMGGLRGRDIPFSNLEPLAGESAPVVPGPTAFDASPATSIDENALRELSTLILPVEGGEFVAPNFFLEVCGECALVDEIEERRACYHGALGARAMHAMQNYGLEEPLYDRAAYTFSATYVWTGSLNLHTHHITPARDPEGPPEYHMTNLGMWNMKESRKGFAEGAAAFRNLLELAAEFRGDMVAEVNVMVGKSAGEGSQD